MPHCRPIGALDVETIVPGHGEPCDKRYLSEQAQIIQNWIGVVEDYVRRGLSEDEAVAEPLDVVAQASTRTRSASGCFR